MEDEEYKIPEYPNQEKGFFIDEQKFGNFSKNLFKVPNLAYISAFCLNVIYINCWRKKMSILSILMTLFIDYLIIQIILKQMLKAKGLE